ncbi:hypothetical protein SCLCIDRAFT_274283 [Scleroderma citrinum Foug A]|uniref:Uncharacterized protein n=1 Tax=Scleroderma citrinum Foug A TaxID=1036808 RepID=A0A0C3DHR5_9AGAM|nr:hypothetical protein SCLCIDRAFT_274283 [Scleroderma citrinum Foug A]
MTTMTAPPAHVDRNTREGRLHFKQLSKETKRQTALDHQASQSAEGLALPVLHKYLLLHGRFRLHEHFCTSSAQTSLPLHPVFQILYLV